MLKQIKVIGFDADDTLWVNEPFYQDVEKEFCLLMKPYLIEKETSNELFKTGIQNLEIYGYGAKGFILAMVETALRATKGKITTSEINRILQMGKTLLAMPIQLLAGVENVLQKLQGSYKLILATKGDLLDQERKLEKSGLIGYFHHIEIMSDKHEDNYKKLLLRLGIEPHEFLMVGNSVKSDILPVINIGAKAVHIPFDVTWKHERNHPIPGDETFIIVSQISDILNIL
jgi:putative hydrolase of the HAD superfamily